MPSYKVARAYGSFEPRIRRQNRAISYIIWTIVLGVFAFTVISVVMYFANGGTIDWSGPDTGYHVEIIDGKECMVTDYPDKSRPEIASCDWSRK